MGMAERLPGHSGWKPKPKETLKEGYPGNLQVPGETSILLLGGFERGTSGNLEINSQRLSLSPLWPKLTVQPVPESFRQFEDVLGFFEECRQAAFFPVCTFIAKHSALLCEN